MFSALEVDYSEDPKSRVQSAKALARSSYGDDDPYDRNLSEKVHYKYHMYDSSSNSYHLHIQGDMVNVKRKNNKKR